MIEPSSGENLVERGGLWMIPAGSTTITDDQVRHLLEEGRQYTPMTPLLLDGGAVAALGLSRIWSHGR